MHENGPGGSPVLYENNLIFHLDGSDKQFIAARDSTTGKLKWKTDRSGELPEKSGRKKAYGTPLLAKIQGKTQLISQGADWLYGYDPDTGKELWRLSYNRHGFSNIARPVIAGDRLFISTGFLQAELQAIDLPPKTKQPELAWSYAKSVPKSPSPLVVGKRIYFVADSGGTLTCLDIENGDVIYRERITGGKYWAAPTYANGHLYFHNEEGVTTVVKAGDEFEVVAENKLEGRQFSSAAITGNDIILRTDKALYRIGDE